MRVVCTKYRNKCIDSVILKRLGEIFKATLEKWECELLEFNGEADHVHLLMSVNPKARLSDLVNNLKTVSSRLIRKEFTEQLAVHYWKPVFWSRSYCILTCGGAPLSVIKQYIENQEIQE
ncbi:MAG: IS200/IS605 family transposase [Pyrinomonadaceae bacterium]